MTSAGPYNIAAGDSIVVSFAIVRGTSLAELQANVDSAQALYPITQVVEDTPAKVFNLSQNQPNPFNPMTTIKFSVEREGPVSLTIFDLSGRKVRTLLNEPYGPGEHTVVWDGHNDAGAPMPSGVYLYRYDSGGRSMTRKMMLVK